VALRGETIGLDLDRAVRLADALSALVTDPLARPVVDELRRVLEAGRGHSAPILDINAERAKRGPTR
jgi:hypothetical protein